MLKVSLLDFFVGKLSVSVLVERLEDLGEAVTLCLAQKLTGNESEGSLLHGGVGVEGFQVAEGGHSLRLIDLDGGELNDPWVLQGSLGTWAVLLLVGEELGDEVLAVVRDVVPDFVIEGEASSAHFLHDLLIALTIERWHAGEKDVADDSAGPDIAFGSVVLVQNFWGNVVWSTKLLIKLLVGVVHEGGSEVNNLDLVKLLVLLKKDVLGFEISIEDRYS